MTEDAVRDTYRKSREARAKLKVTLEDSGKLLERSVLSLVILGGYFALTLFSTNDDGIDGAPYVARALPLAVPPGAAGTIWAQPRTGFAR